jgi:hypothetical protein
MAIPDCKPAEVALDYGTLGVHSFNGHYRFSPSILVIDQLVESI